MLQERNRKLVIIAYVVGVVFILAALAVRWNTSLTSEGKLGVLPLIYSIIAIISVSYLFRLALTLSDTKAFKDYVDLKVSEGRTTLLEEIRIENEKKKESVDEIDDSEEKAKELIPTGNFKTIEKLGKKILVNIANEMNLVQAILYLGDAKAIEFNFSVGYALESNKEVPGFKLGEGLHGETAKNQEIIVVNDIPENYFMIESGLGKSQPGNLYIVPILSDKKTIAIIELASFIEIGDKNLKILQKASELISKKIKQIVKA